MWSILQINAWELAYEIIASTQGSDEKQATKWAKIKQKIHVK